MTAKLLMRYGLKGEGDEFTPGMDDGFLPIKKNTRITSAQTSIEQILLSNVSL